MGLREQQTARIYPVKQKSQQEQHSDKYEQLKTGTAKETL